MRELAQKLLSLAALTFAIELVLFKFLPDLSTALLQHQLSSLSDYGQFERDYLVPGSVHYARFLGNNILYHLAKWLGTLYGATDPRLHPLRVAAGILTPIYACLGAYCALGSAATLAWRHFMAPYTLMIVIGMYVFYPADLPSLAFFSMALYFLLAERLWPALLLMLVTGLFRETSFHVVWLVAAWAWCSGSRARGTRLAWVIAFSLAFAIEYALVRWFFPGPVSSAGGVIFDPRVVFLDDGALSPTAICSLGLAIVFPLTCLLRVRDIPADDWRRAFFTLNCYVFPAWVVFYRMMNGNLSELRMLFPVLLPCIYGIAYAAATRPTRSQSGT